MGKLFLASTFSSVAPMVSRLLHNEQKGKKALFVMTAAEVEAGEKQWLKNDRNALINIGLQPIDYSISNKKKEDFPKDFKNINYIFVSGRNTFYLLEKAQQSGFIPFLTNYMQDQNVYIGSSAGSAIAGADIYPLLNVDDATQAPNLQGYKGFGFIDLTILPHWGNESFKDSYLNRRLEQAYSDKYKLILLTDNQFIYVDKDGKYSILEA